MLSLQKIRVNQPQIPVGISSYAQNLKCVVASLNSVRGYNSTTGILPRSVGADVSFVPSPYGLSQRGSATGSGVAYGSGGFNTIVPVDSEWTIMMLVRITTTGTRRIFLGDYNSGGTGSSVSIEQTATNSWRALWINLGPAEILINAGTVTTGWHWVEYQSAISGTTLWVDGIVVGSTSGTTTRSLGTDYRVGMPGAVPSVGFDGDIATHFVFSSALNTQARAAIRLNPWLLFSPQHKNIPLSILSSGSYSLNLETGVYSFTGNAATLTKDSKLTLDSGTYALSGSNASLLKGLILEAASGTYSLTGSDASVLYTHLLNSSSGSYSITGSDATLTYTPTSGAYTLNLESGAYLLTGSDVTFISSGAEVTIKAGSWIRYRIIT